MLESLSIRNYAIIDELTVRFSGGLNVITGETGAGKSIIVDALELVLGARSSTDMIRAGAESMAVAGVFAVEPGFPRESLACEPEEGMLILRREIRSDGGGRSYVNDRPVTLRALRDIGDRLVDLHGQHDHQSLLAVPEHVRFLDGFGGLEQLARETAELYSGYTAALDAVASLRDRIEFGRRDRELHRFQIGEIEAAALSPNEDAELEQRILTLSRAADLKSLGFHAFQELSERDGAFEERLGGLAGRVRELSRYDERLAPLLAELEGIIAGVGELAHEFRSYGERIEDDPAKLAELESSLAQIEKLKKKYGPTLDDVFVYHRKITGETEGAEHLECELAESEADLAALRSRLLASALLLSRKRRETAPLLAKEVEAHLAELGMSGARLVVEFTPLEGGRRIETDGSAASVGRNGLDRVEFLIAANPGEPPRPLVKVASGGEMSRIMLALKLTLSGVDSVPTMVFDEIDSGVSGRVAEAVGKKLGKLAETRQTLVITHLPQIAVMADCHFSARKCIEDGRARTNLVLLDRPQREEELASLLSGGTVTGTALAHAREMMKVAPTKQRMPKNGDREGE
jgi:DNA repair protein RecN (Recombination protein N)